MTPKEYKTNANQITHTHTHHLDVQPTKVHDYEYLQVSIAFPPFFYMDVVFSFSVDDLCVFFILS